MTTLLASTAQQRKPEGLHPLMLPAALALDVTHVSKRFGKEASRPQKRHWPWQRSQSPAKKVIVAVNDVSLQVNRNEIFGILGANGSGKSTLIRLFSTLLLPDDGKVTVFGYDVLREEMAVKRLINRVSVDAAFFKKLSPMENLMYAARLYNMDGKTAHAEAIRILTFLGIKREQIFQPVENMSRGMQQKVAIARAFLTSPVLLLLDEPTTGLDPRSKRDVQEFIFNLRNVHDATILLTTHDMEEADRLCDRIAILDEGRVVALDTPAGLKRRLPRTNGHDPTMEDVFFALTGKTLKEDEEDEEDEGDKGG